MVKNRHQEWTWKSPNQITRISFKFKKKTERPRQKLTVYSQNLQQWKLQTSAKNKNELFNTKAFNTTEGL